MQLLINNLPTWDEEKIRKVKRLAGKDELAFVVITSGPEQEIVTIYNWMNHAHNEVARLLLKKDATATFVAGGRIQTKLPDSLPVRYGSESAQDDFGYHRPEGKANQLALLQRIKDKLIEAGILEPTVDNKI